MKKFKKFIKKLFMRKLVVKTNTTNHLHVKEVNLNAEGIVDALGMTRERAIEIAKIVFDEYPKHKNVVAAMENMSKHCKHANELYFMTVSVEKLHSQQAAMTALGSIFKHL